MFYRVPCIRKSSLYYLSIMSQQEVRQLFAAPLTLKEYCVIGLLYESGLRISEVTALCIQDIESAS